MDFSNPQLTNLNKRHYSFDDLAAAVIAEQGASAKLEADRTPENVSAFLSVARLVRQIRDARQREAAEKAGL